MFIDDNKKGAVSMKFVPSRKASEIGRSREYVKAAGK